MRGRETRGLYSYELRTQPPFRRKEEEKEAEGEIPHVHKCAHGTPGE
jgi:hypothetical protein